MLSTRVTRVFRYIILITYIKVITYNNTSTLTDRTIHTNTPDIAVLDQTIKEAHLRDEAIPNSHNLHSTIAKNLLKFTDLK